MTVTPLLTALLLQTAPPAEVQQLYAIAEAPKASRIMADIETSTSRP